MKCFNSNLIQTNSRHTLYTYLEEPNPFFTYINTSILSQLTNTELWLFFTDLTPLKWVNMWSEKF